MKYYENNSYVNHGAIPSNEYAKNKDDRTLEANIETERTQTVDDEVTRQLNRSLWMLEKKRNTGSKSSVNGF